MSNNTIGDSLNSDVKQDLKAIAGTTETKEGILTNLIKTTIDAFEVAKTHHPKRMPEGATRPGVSEMGSLAKFATIGLSPRMVEVDD